MAVSCKSQQAKLSSSSSSSSTFRRRSSDPQNNTDTLVLGAKKGAPDSNKPPPQSSEAAAAERAYTLRQIAPGGNTNSNTLSPAWSTSTTTSNEEDYNGATPLGLLTRNNEMDLAGLLFEQGAQQWLLTSCSQEMYPSLLPSTETTDGQNVTTASSCRKGLAVSSSEEAGLAANAHGTVATHAESMSNTSTDAVLDGWLQQFVNAEAIGGATTALVAASPPSSTVYSPDIPFSTDAVTALLSASPAMVHEGTFSSSSPSRSPMSTAGTDLLDQSAVSALAAAVTSSSSMDAISPELLASVLSSAAGICAYDGAAEAQEMLLLPPTTVASEISMLAALPFTTLAMPAANIAPQKTLSVASVAGDAGPTVPDTSISSGMSQPVAPPSKRQRRSDPQPLLLKTSSGVENDDNGRGSSSQGSKSVASKKSTTVPAAPGNRHLKATVSPVRPIAPASKANHTMVPLAPRQPPPPAQSTASDANKKKAKESTNKNKDGKRADTCASSGSSSGSSTPPGLSVLAKIAQKQVPIRVKEEEGSMAAGTTAQQHSYQGRLIAPGPAHRQTRSPPLKTEEEETHVQSPSTADSTAQKRQERLIKNRAAALLSRKRKRDYMTKLESEIEDLRTSNTTLVRRMEEMERAMMALAEERDRLQCENEAARASATVAASSAGTSTSTSTTNSTSTSTTNSTTNSTSTSTSSKSTEENKKDEKPPEESSSGDAEASDDPMEIDNTGEETQQRGTGSGANSKQRTAGALLMAMLFSFSLFTLPSLYTSSNQLTAGGPQSAGIIPIRSLPSPEEPRLLIGSSSSKTADGATTEPPLIERVRRSITALAQQAEPAANGASSSGGDSCASHYANGSDSAGTWMRPMTMEESAELHTWIRHGLAPKDDAPPPAIASSVPRIVDSQNDCSVSVVHRQLRQTKDYAMLYCPAMQHVVFGSDTLGTAALTYRPSAPRVIETAAKQEENKVLAVVHRGMDDVDSEIIASPRVAAAASQEEELVAPTHVGLFNNRPRLSLYSPVVGSRESSGEILPPWDEYARLASDDVATDGSGTSSRQKYLRIDVEVVGSRWVTADKFAHGLY